MITHELVPQCPQGQGLQYDNPRCNKSMPIIVGEKIGKEHNGRKRKKPKATKEHEVFHEAHYPVSTEFRLRFDTKM
jgi:hypothetical protein